MYPDAGLWDVHNPPLVYVNLSCSEQFSSDNQVSREEVEVCSKLKTESTRLIKASCVSGGRTEASINTAIKEQTT